MSLINESMIYNYFHKAICSGWYAINFLLSVNKNESSCDPSKTGHVLTPSQCDITEALVREELAKLSLDNYTNSFQVETFSMCELTFTFFPISKHIG